MDKYVALFMKEDMIGPEGILGEIGLIALPDCLFSNKTLTKFSAR